MHLRPDITEAAARLTSGFDVSRELRQLGAHLREGETVYRLAAGVYGSGGGLLAVTDRRVLLLRDGRTGQASEGFPLERISAVRWTGGPGRGAIVISDAHNSAELGQVEPTEGNSVVTFIRSLLPNELHDELGGQPDKHGELDVRLDEREDLLTHAGLALVSAGAGAANGTRSHNGALNGSANGSLNGSANGTATTRSGRFAVPMKVRTPPERAGGLPEQKTAERPPGAVRPDSGDQDRYGLRDQVAGLDRDRFPDSEPVNGSGRFSGPEHVDGPGRYGERANGHRHADLDRDDFRDDYRDEFRDDFRRDEVPGRGGYAERDYTERDYTGRDVTGRDRADRDLPARELPEPDLGYPARDERTGRFADRDLDRDDYPGRDRYDERDQPPGYGAQASAPGLHGVEGSGQLAGEVPVSRLAEETGGTRVAASGERDRVRRSGEYDRVEPGLADHDRPDYDRAGYDRAGSDRAGSDRSEAAEETGQLNAALGGRRGSAARRGESSPGRPDSGRRSGRTGPALPNRKWLVIGGAAVFTVAVIGGMIVATSGDDTPVAPAPVAVESAGPLVTVTKVIDGDSIEVEGSVHAQVEIVGIAAPRTDKDQCGSADSSQFATRALAGKQVTLITDRSQPMTDKNGRRLASVRTDNGLDYATLAAQAGMVRYYEGSTPVAQASEIKAAQAEAEKAERGLWGPPCKGKTSTSKSSSNSSSSSSASSTRSSSNSSNAGTSTSTGSGTSRTDSLDGSGLDG